MVRSKLIITGAIGVLAAVTLTVNAQSGGQRTTGSLGAVMAARVQLLDADHAQMANAVRATIAAAVVAQSAKPVSNGTPRTTTASPKSAAARVALSAGCQAALNQLKALRQADEAEDARERAAATTPITATALAAEKAEDAAELQQWKTALAAVRTACVPQPTASCKAAVNSLQAMLQNLRAIDWRSIRTRTDWSTTFAPIRTAFAALRTACAANI